MLLIAAMLLLAGCRKESESALVSEAAPMQKAIYVAADAEAAEKEKFAAAFETRLPADMLRRILDNYHEFSGDVKTVLKTTDAGLLTLVDKKHFLAADFVPADLVALKTNRDYTVSKTGMYADKQTVDALHKMGQAAIKDGVTLMVSSAYRSYQYQKNLFARYASQYGEAEAERFSARAGTSQHQLGTVFDFGSITDDFAKTKQGRWLTAHAGEFGFSLSFPQGYEAVTGYKWECWHFRYIGCAACEIQQKWFGNIQQYTLEVLFWYRKTDTANVARTTQKKATFLQ